MDIVDPMRIYHRYCVQVMKDDLEGLPLRTHGPETTNGYLLVIFLSTVLHSKIRSLLRDSKLRMSLQNILLDLSKIRKVVLRDGTTLTTEMSKKQRDIIKALGIRLGMKGEYHGGRMVKFQTWA